MFLNKFPYSDNQQLNLDWVIEQIRYLSEAAHISFDDTIAGLGTDNVQGAIEKLKELLDYYSQQFVDFAIIESAIPESYFTGGHTYNHIQTVNDATLMSIIDAVKLGRYIVLKRTSGNTANYFICSTIDYVPGDYKHEVILIDPVTLVTSEVDIYGLNDTDNIYCDIIADINQTRVTDFNGRTGSVTPQASDYDADQVDYDDSNTNLGATDVQAAIEAIKALIPLLYVASFNGRTGTVTPQASDYDADQIDYDNTVSGIVATDVQAAIDEIVNLVLSSGVASFNGRTGAVNPQAGDYDADQIDYDNTSSELTATDVQEAIDDVDSEIDAIVNVYGSKNLLQNSYKDAGQTYSGVTMTENVDGSITLNGIASAVVYFTVISENDDWKIPAGSYIATAKNTNANVSFNIAGYNGNIYVSTLAIITSDSEVSINPDYVGYDRIGIFIKVENGTDLTTPLTIYPMIRDSRIADDTYVPFAMTNKELTDKLLTIKQTTVNTTFDANGNAYIGALSSLGYPLCFVPDISTNIPLVVVCDGNGSINLKSINSDWSLDMIGVGSVPIIGTLYTLSI